jgi:uncharacterized membrane protein
MTKGEIAGLVILAVSLIVAAVCYPKMPELMASHWNAAGEVDGHASRLAGLLLAPIVIAVMWLLFVAIPRIDPLKKNIARFRGIFDWFIVVMLLFVLSIEAQVVLWNLNVKLPPWATMPIALGFLFLFVGLLLGKAKRNYFIGIRTPWTLASDVVWDKTHRLGSRLFMISGGIALLGVLFGRYAGIFILVPVLVSTAVVVVYSYAEYARLPAD